MWQGQRTSSPDAQRLRSRTSRKDTAHSGATNLPNWRTNHREDEDLDQRRRNRRSGVSRTRPELESGWHHNNRSTGGRGGREGARGGGEEVDCGEYYKHCCPPIVSLSAAPFIVQVTFKGQPGTLKFPSKGDMQSIWVYQGERKKVRSTSVHNGGNKHFCCQIYLNCTFVLCAKPCSKSLPGQRHNSLRDIWCSTKIYKRGIQ